MNVKSCLDFQEALSAQLDGPLDDGARQALEAHLRHCADCRALAADLHRLKEAAAALPPVTPPLTLWPRLSSRLEAAGVRRAQAADGGVAAPVGDEPRSWLGALGGWLVASPLRLASLSAAALVVLAVGTAVILYRPSAPATGAPGPIAATGAAATGAAGGAVHAVDQDLVESVENELRMAAQHYENAIPGLQQIAQSGQASLEPAVAASLQKSLGVIDMAINDIKSLLAREPGNLALLQNLIDAFRSKVSLLQDTVALINEMRKGNQAEAARIIQKVNQS